MANKNNALYILSSLALCLLLSPYCFSQSTTASLTGTVVDEKGSVIPAAKVTVVNPDTKSQRQVTADDSGYFVVPLLPPATYMITVEHDGFAPATIRQVTLNVGDQRSLQIQLRAGAVSEVVTVTGTAETQESPTVATVVDRQFVENIPLNGRSFQSLITMTPGVVLAVTNYLEQGQFSVNGARTDTNYFTVDGVSANFGTANNIGGSNGSGSQPALTALGGTNSLVSVDAIQEFQIQTSTFAPEFGRTPGAQVAIVTRSGGNQFHGTAFDYFRNGILDANDYFSNLEGLAKPIEKQNDFGGVFSGPIIKDKLFFFFSYEGLRLVLPATAITSVPDLALRAEAPAAVKPFLDASPLPNGPEVGDMFAQFAASYTNPASLDAYSLKMDYSINSKLQLFGRYDYSPSSLTQRESFADLAVVGPQVFRVETFTFGLTDSVSATMVNEIRVNYSTQTGSDTTHFDNFGGAVPAPDSVLFHPPFNTADDEYQLRYLNGDSGFAVGKAATNENRQLNIVDNFSWTVGSHQLKFGVDYRRLKPTISGAALDEIPEFSGSAGVLSSTIDSAVNYGNEATTLLFHNYGFYAQDTWKINPQLQLTYGLRWDVNPAPTGASSQFDPATLNQFTNLGTATLAPAGTPLYHTTYDNFAPRIGVAYKLRDQPGSQTVFRGGFGIFYDLGSGGLADLVELFPFASQKYLSNVPFPETQAQATPLPNTRTLPTTAIEVADPNLQLPRTYQWNLTVEQSIGSAQTLTVSYIGSAGRRLLYDSFYYNPTAPISEPIITTNKGTSDYESLQVKFQRRLSHGLQALTTYTWSHSIDTSSQSSFDQLNFPFGTNPSVDRGDSDFDIRHQFTTALTWDIPAPGESRALREVLGNWSVDSIFTARSALPVTVDAPIVVGFGGLYYPRPDVVPGVPFYLYGSQYPGGKAFNPAAFTSPPGGVQGDLGRNVLRGFDLWQEDLDIRRRFPITERAALSFRAEFFNVFNHPNFGSPNTTLGAPFFGVSTQMLGASLGSGGGSGGFSPLYQVGGARSIQFALKLQF